MRLLTLCRSVRVGVSVQSRDGKVQYEYKKPLPEDIEPERCTHKVGNTVIYMALHICIWLFDDG